MIFLRYVNKSRNTHKIEIAKKRQWILLLLFVLSLFAHEIAYAKTLFQVDIRGVNESMGKNAQMRFAMEIKNHLPLTPQKVRTLYRSGPKFIREALQPYGYFKPHISSCLARDTQGRFIATYTIVPGPPLQIRAVDLSVSGPGADNPRLRAYEAHFPLQAGDTFDSIQYEKTKEEWFRIANNQGYIKAFVEKNQILIDLRRYSATIILHLNTGERYYFGRVTFSNRPYAPDFLQRFVPFTPDEPFSSKRILELQQEMQGSPYFRQVDIVPNLLNPDDHHIPIEITALPPKSQRYNFGAGFGSLTGPRFTAGMNLRRITDTGHHMDAQLKWSSVLSGLALRYYIPGPNPLTDLWVIGTRTQHFRPKAGKSTSQTFFGGFTRKLKHWQYGVYLNFLFERYAVFPDPLRNSHMLYPSFSVTYVRTDEIINPQFGEQINFLLQGGTRHVLSSTNFVQAQIKGRYLLSPFSFSRLMFRGNLGYTSVRDLFAFPLSLRFFAGGIDSVRGFADSSIGPGRYLMIASGEYRQRVYGNLFLAFFYDAGKAANHFDSRWNRGRGIGLVYESPIGPIRVYGAEAISKRTRPRSIELSIGPEF